MIETNINNNIETNNHLKYLFKFNTILITIVAIIFIIYALKLGIFEDKNILVNQINNYGILGPLIFIIFQILQVIVPIIPGGISNLAGVLAFGPIQGFLYNYIGLVIGSCLAYYISKKYGITIIQKIFKRSTINKYLKYINHSFKTIFLICIILPGFPDDLLCYIAGISSLKFKSFLFIILIGKPISLLVYSLFINLL